LSYISNINYFLQILPWHIAFFHIAYDLDGAFSI